MALNLFVSLVLFLSAIFLSPAICYKLPRARNNKNRSFHLPLRQPAVIVWCWHSGLSNPENFVGILTLFTSRVNTGGVRSRHAFLLVSRIRPMVSVDKLCDDMGSFEIIELLRKKLHINFKKYFTQKWKCVKNFAG